MYGRPAWVLVLPAAACSTSQLSQTTTQLATPTSPFQILTSLLCRAAGITGLVFYSLWAGVPILLIAWVGCAVQRRIPRVTSLSDYALRVSLPRPAHRRTGTRGQSRTICSGTGGGGERALCGAP